MEAPARSKLETPKRTSEISDNPKGFAALVGESIRLARQERGWTQAQLAEGAGLSVNYVSRLERGELGPSLFVAARIAEALRLSLETLVAGKPIRRSTGLRRVAT